MPDVTFEGRYSRFARISLSPRPLQQPHPPIWVAGRKDGAMLRAAKYGDGWLPYMYTPEMLHVGLFIFVSIGPNREEAMRQAAQALGRNYAQDFSRIV